MFSAKVVNTVPTIISEAGVEEPRVPLTPECEAGLAALNAADSDHTGKVGSVSVAAETIATSRDGVDITAPFFRDLLADSPVQGADAIRSLADWSGGSAGSGGSAKTAAGSTSWDGEAEKMAF
jgi:phage baseplate assembly protein gpV